MRRVEKPKIHADATQYVHRDAFRRQDAGEELDSLEKKLDAARQLLQGVQGGKKGICYGY